MTLKDLARAVAAKTLNTIEDTERTLTVAFQEIGKTLVKVEKVSIHEFGVFEPVEKPATTARNPATGAPVAVAAKTAVKLKLSKALKDKLSS